MVGPKEYERSRAWYPPHLPGGAEYSIVKDLNQVNPRSGGRGTIPVKGKTPTDATAVKLI